MSGAVRSAVVRLSANVSGLIAGYAEAKAATEDFARSTTASTNKAASAVTSLSEKHKKAINTISTGFGIMGAAAAAGLGLAVKTAADFDAKMSEVQAATNDGANGMDHLRAAAIKAGADTVFSAGEAADGITNLAKAGISTADILNGGLKGALSLASAGQIDVGAAAEDTATALTQFGLKGAAASHVADLLAASANKAQGEVGDMAIALNYAGIPAAQLGVSINQAVGTIALFAKSGLIGSQAGTTLRGVLSSLTSPSKVAAQEMQSLGISVFDAKGNFIGLDGLAQQLHDHMGNLTQAERSYALGRIFGNQQLQGANILYKAGAAGVQEWTKNVNDSGYAAQVAATKMNNLKGDVENLSGSLQTALIGTGEGSQTPLRSLTQNLTKLVNKYNDLGPAAQSNVAKTLGAAALLGGSAFVIGKTVIGINSAATALSGLGVTATGARGALVGLGKGIVVAAAVYGVDQIANHLFAAHNKAHELRQDLQYLALGVPATPKLDFGYQDLGHEIRDASQQLHTLGSGFTDFLAGHGLAFTVTTDNVKQLDHALARLAKTDPKTAASAFASIRQQAHAAGVSMKDLMALFPQYEALVHQHQTKGNMIDFADLGAGLHSLQRYRSALMQLPRNVLTRVVNPNLLNTTKQVEKLAKQYKLTPKEVRTIMRARDFAGPEIQKVLKELKLLDKQHPKPTIDANNKPATDRYRVTKAQMIELGHAHPMATLDANFHPFNEAFRLAMTQAGIVDRTHARAILDANNGPLDAAVAQAQARINSLHGTTVTNYVNTVHRVGGPQSGLAGGGPVVGGGTKTSDSVALWGSNGEFMMRAAAVDRYGLDFMYRVNAMQLAAGGPVTHAPVATPVNAVAVARGANQSPAPKGGDTTVFLTLTDAQFRRFEVAAERGTAKGTAKGMRVLTQAIYAEEHM